MIRLADEAKKRKNQREKDKLERDGKTYGNFSGPKNFIKDHKITVAGRTADFLRMREQKLKE